VRALAALLIVAGMIAVPGALAREAQNPPRVCEGLTICSPVAGPWVVVPGPAKGAGVGKAVWQLACPRGFVGGLDARVADPWIEVTFPGFMGSPVNPGITTRRTVVFNAVSAGPRGRLSSFIPFVGCIPGEGGPRTPTGVGSSAAPAQLGVGPIDRHVRIVELFGREITAGLGCPPGRRLVESQAALGIFTALKPTQRQLHGVVLRTSLVGGKIFIKLRRTTLPQRIPVQVQIHALCSGTWSR
jgi:hypothetical protein